MHSPRPLSVLPPDPAAACEGRRAAPFLQVLAGVGAFLALLFGLALWRLAGNAGSMDNKFSALAVESHRGFLLAENLRMLPAYLLLALAGAALIQPAAAWWSGRSRRRGRLAVGARAFGLAVLVHGWFHLRLIETRPYFLHELDFGHWYFEILKAIPPAAQPAAHGLLFAALPAAAGLAAIVWHLRRLRAVAVRRSAAAALCGTGLVAAAFHHWQPHRAPAQAGENRPPNVLIIASDSLRGDRLGFAGHRPARADGAAAAGVSPTIDALAGRSAIFERCYTPIASTLESGTSLMTSQYPHSHGIRQMYPDRGRVEEARKKTRPIADLLREQGYDTAAIGDWCSGYYEVMPLGFEHVSVSSFDNFKIYMSQAVTMAHFVIPLYFDNQIGYKLYPQIGSFAQFVTPEVVTSRVEKRLAAVAREGRPFFWHLFYSSNHLPYRSTEPYSSMFTDPGYRGRNKNGVDFDIDAFIGGTDLEDKWSALPEREIEQIRALYDGCTRQFDDHVARVLAALEREGLAENTIVVVTADHGDDLYEPGVTLGHGLTLNGGSQANHVPLVMHVPGTGPRRFSETVRTIDLMPTLADLLGVEKPAIWEGRSFAGWISGAETPEWRPFYAETGFPFIQFRVPGVERPKLPPMDEMTTIEADFNYQFVLKEPYRQPLVDAKQRCLQTRSWKLVCTPTADGSRHFGLFHLDSDPHCESDLAGTRPGVLGPMRTALERWIDARVETPIGRIFPEGEPEA